MCCWSRSCSGCSSARRARRCFARSTSLSCNLKSCRPPRPSKSRRLLLHQSVPWPRSPSGVHCPNIFRARFIPTCPFMKRVPNRLATPAQRQDEQPRTPVLATVGIAHHWPRAVVNLRLFTEFGLDDRPRFRRCGAVQIAHESPHALVATREPVAVDQILPDTHRVPVALQLQRDQFTVRLAVARRPATRFLAQKAGDHLYGRF